MGIQKVSPKGLKPVAGYPGYFVSCEGKVFSTRPINGKGNKEGELRGLKPLLCSSRRYLQFSAGDGTGRRVKILIHRAVTAAFIGPCPEGYEVSHKDGNSHNNHVSNLEYCSHRDNEKMKKTHGTDSAGERNANTKLTEAQVHEIRTRVKAGKRGTARRVAREFGISESHVSMLVAGKRWDAKVKEWKFECFRENKSPSEGGAGMNGYVTI